MVHDAASAGFGSEASRYQTARPDYHPDLVERFVDRFASGRVVEIGAGTGKFTSQLVAAGISPVAVEPVEAMRAVLAADLPWLDVRSGTAEAIPAENDSFETAVVAQGFHWFDYQAALDEIYRVVRLGGHLVTVWNVKAGDSDWYRRYMEIVDRYADDTPRHADMRWRRAIDDDQRFELVDDWHIDNSQAMDRESIVSRALSTSFIAALPDQTKMVVADELREALVDIESQVRFPYRGELQAFGMDGPSGISRC